MTRERIAHVATERCLHPREALDRRFPLDEHTAEIPLVRETLDRCLVDRLLFHLQKSEHLRGKRGRYSLENFVRFHRSQFSRCSCNLGNMFLTPNAFRDDADSRI